MVIMEALEKYIKNSNEQGNVEINTTGNNVLFENQIRTMFNKNYIVK